MEHFENIRASLGSLDAMLITGKANRFYATGFDATDGMAIVTKDDAYFFTDPRYIEVAEKEIKGAKVLCVSDGHGKSYSDMINKIAKQCGIETLGFEEDQMSYAGYMSYSQKIKPRLVPNAQAVLEQRAVKTPEEIEVMVKAQRIAEKAFNEVLGMISTDMTEKELALELLYAMMKNGAEDKSFDTIVVSGEKSSMPHGVPGDEKIKKGFLTIDFGAKYKGYCSDTTRTLCIGKPTEEMKKVYYTVLSAQKAGIEAAKAGVSGYDIDKAARDIIDGAGYEGLFGHAFGHGLGVEIHELPRASRSYMEKIPEGAVISAEPGVYIPGKFGVRIEDVLVITKDGSENITKLDKELVVL